MDIATLIGFILAWASMMVAFVMEGGKFSSLFSPSALVLVLGGSAGATIFSFKLKHSTNITSVVKQAFFSKAIERLELLKQIVELAKKARKDGILALEAQIATLTNPFLRQSLQLVVDGTQPELVREIMETEIDAMQARHKAGEEFFGTWGGYAPTLGIIGTVMGLVHMLENLSDPGGMGPAIATAFLATLYGVCFANLFLLPVGTKLKIASHEELESYNMAVEGILSLQAGDNPRVVGMKMRSFLSAPEKQKMDAEMG